MPSLIGLSRFCRLRKIAKHRLVALSIIFASASASLAFIDTALAATDTTAIAAVEKLQVKGKAPKTGYERSLFSDGWGDIGSCDARNYILRRDLKSVTLRDSCKVDTGTLKDPYTGKIIRFKYGVGTSSAVQIDHVVALSDAWQKGAQQHSAAKRYAFYNDPLNLLAVDGPTNASKGDSDASAWLPPNKGYRCSYIARQVAVKLKYKIWVIEAEKAAMKRVLSACPSQKLPIR
ncbi:MAG: hypothetical protein RL600_495 [Actinomycetota bacterium]|jgi:Protein of unknown function (DUF1524)|nr:hypothetical protein RKACHI23_05020 [Rhodoluna lacicola]